MLKRLDDDRQATWGMLLSAYETVRGSLEQELAAEESLPLTWYEVMLHLGRAPGTALRMQDLARVALLSKSGLSQVVTRMEEAGLVRRQSCPSDRRGTFAVLTDHGRKAFAGAARVHLRGIEEHFTRHLSEPELRQLRSFLEKVLEGQRPQS